MKDPEKVRAYNKAYYSANRDRERARSAAYRAAHAEQVRAAQRRWSASRPDYRSAWYAANREKAIGYVKKFYIANRDAVLEKQAARRRADPKKSRAYAAAYRKEHPGLIGRAMRAWRAAHPDEVRTHKIARRVRLLGNGGSHTAQEWREKVALFAGCCVYCGESKPLVRDHNVPLARGGTNDIGNILPACHSCNARKHARTAREFLGLAENKPTTGEGMLMPSAR